jgi:hypothetical protein
VQKFVKFSLVDYNCPGNLIFFFLFCPGMIFFIYLDKDKLGGTNVNS